MPPALLDFRHVTVLRGIAPANPPALDDITLRIASGEHVCILGPNGSGKSTLIKTIARECYPVVSANSSLEILGRSRWDVFELRNLLGIVSPDLLASCAGANDGDITARDLVISGFFSSTRLFPHHHPSPELEQRADAALSRIGIAPLANRPVSQMSSGEAKRTLIARALVHEPHSLLLDEPSNTLDIAAQAALCDSLRRLARAGLGIILVTHHVSEIIPEIERVIFLKEGRIVADGPKHTLLTAARLSELFGVSVELHAAGGCFHIL